MRAVCIGECMVEMGQQGALYARNFAGDTYNVAVYLRRSFPELKVQFLTAVGEDSMSRAMRAAWRDEGVGDELAFVAPGRLPGLYLIELSAAGERNFLYWRSASAARHWLERLEQNRQRAALAAADLVYFSGISLAILDAADRPRALAALEELRGRGGVVAFDPNFRAALWPDLKHARSVLDRGARTADIVLASSDDVAAIYGVEDPEAQMAALRETGAREVVITRGAEGGVVWNGGAAAAIYAPSVRAVDTTGAGDAFKGAYLAERLRGRAPQAAARVGTAVAARVVTSPGAIVPASISHPKDAS